MKKLTLPKGFRQNGETRAKLCSEDEDDEGTLIAPDDSNPLRVVGVFGSITNEICAGTIFQLISLAAKGINVVEEEEDEDCESKEEKTCEVVYEPIEILISSTGGVVEGTFGVYDIIQVLKNKGVEIVTTAVGTCQSAATILLVSGTKRRATKSCRFMIHNVIAAFEGSLPALKELSKETELLQKMYIDMLLKHTKLTDKQLKKILKERNHYFSAQQALEYGMIDEII